MESTKWNDRAMDSALEEVAGGGAPSRLGPSRLGPSRLGPSRLAPSRLAPSSLVQSVLDASVEERRVALDRVHRAATPVSRFSRQTLSIAALLLFGATIVFGIWMVQAQEDKNFAGNHWQDPVRDPKRVMPKSVAELTKMLEQVTGISYRQCTMQLPTPVGTALLDFDVDMEALFPIRDAAVRARLLAGIAAAAKRPARKVRVDMVPGCRLVLHLKGGRNVHALVQLGLTLRILASADFELPSDASFSKIFQDACMGSNYHSMAHIGVATIPAVLKQEMDGKPLFDRNRTSLRVLQCQMWEDMSALDEFTKLRSLTLEYSTGLDSKSFWRSGWPLKTRAVFANLRQFSCPCLRITDGELASLLSFMPKVEELDLSNCPSIGVRTLEHLGKMASLHRVDLSATKGWTVPDLQLLAKLPEGASVLISQNGISLGARAKLNETTAGRVIWCEK